MFCDTHTHLFADEFKDDIDAVVANALSKGVSKFYLPNIDSSSIEKMLTLSKRYSERMFPMIGLHPCSVKENYEEELAIVESWLSNHKFCAIGEIGIDLYWDKTFIEEQKMAFRFQINLAKKQNLPIVIHVRDSFDEIFELVDELNSDELTGIFHCFTGTLEQANHILGYGGFKLGFGGVGTFKNSGLDKVVEHIDLHHFVLETDSPYLAPVPHRGKRNESAYILEIATKLAELKHVSVEEVEKVTSENAFAIYGC